MKRLFLIVVALIVLVFITAGIALAQDHVLTVRSECRYDSDPTWYKCTGMYVSVVNLSHSPPTYQLGETVFEATINDYSRYEAFVTIPYPYNDWDCVCSPGTCHKYFDYPTSDQLMTARLICTPSP